MIVKRFGCTTIHKALYKYIIQKCIIHSLIHSFMEIPAGDRDRAPTLRSSFQMLLNRPESRREVEQRRNRQRDGGPAGGTGSQAGSQGRAGTDLGKGTEFIFAALKVLMSTVASIIRKWKKFGTTRTPPACIQSDLYSRVARWKPLLSKRHKTARLEFPRRHLKDSQTMRQNSLV